MPYHGKIGIVLVNRISLEGIEVDNVKVEATEKLPLPTFVEGVRSFLGLSNFYQRFIQGFSSNTKHLCPLLMKDAPFNFDVGCLEAFWRLKKSLTSPLTTQEQNLPFEIICEASDYAIGTVLSQRK